MSRELDTEVAEKVMGWVRGGTYDRDTMIGWYSSDGEYKNVAWMPDLDDGIDGYRWSPSVDIKAAWDVWDRMAEMGWTEMSIESPMNGDGVWRVCFTFPGDAAYGPVKFDAPTAPEAICRAALKAVND